MARTFTNLMKFAALAFAALALPAQAKDKWSEVYQAAPAYYDFSGATNPAIVKIGNPDPTIGTIRFSFRIAAGGKALRIRFSNEAGKQPLVIDSATIALGRAEDGEPTGPLLPVRFGGQPAITLAAGAPAISDEIALETQAFSTLVVSIYTSGGMKLLPFGGAGMLVAEGDQTAAVKMAGAKLRIGRPAVSGVTVLGDKAQPVVVAFGDSITDGLRKDPTDLQGYPEQLAKRLAALPAKHRRVVVDSAIGGNRVLASSWGDSALVRLDRDVLRIANVTHLILLEGINDIGSSGVSAFGSNPVVTAEQLIAAYRQIIARCHQRGIKVIGGTLLPFKGAMYYSPEKEMVRTAVNQWIRSSGEFDGVIDFAKITADPDDPLKMHKDFDSGDHLHPGNAGYKAMGDAIDLRLFR